LDCAHFALRSRNQFVEFLLLMETEDQRALWPRNGEDVFNLGLHLPTNGLMSCWLSWTMARNCSRCVESRIQLQVSRRTIKIGHHLATRVRVRIDATTPTVDQAAGHCT